MAFILYSSGVRLEWDENVSIGSLIRTYYSGYWILERIEFQEMRSRIAALEGTKFDSYAIEWSHEDMKEVPIYHFVQVLNDDGKPTRKNRKSCAASYCRRITKDYMESQAQAEHDLADAKAAAITQFL